MKIVAVVLLTLLAVLPGAPAAAAPGITWGPCPDLGMPATGLECATIAVPLDYRHPDGEQIEVAVSRLPSTNPAERRGVLLTNPGGPGEPGLSLPLALASAGLPASVRETYDIIGFDPRGIGYSTPVSCALPPELQTTNVPPYARDAADVVAQAERARDRARRCAEAPTARLLPYISTANTARDMDRIRAALGERKISYLGYSYGTYLGAVYATLFTGRTDRTVLDSALGKRGLDVTASRRFALGFQDRLPDFAAWAAARHATYGLGATPAEVTAKYFELAGRLDQTPVAGIDGPLFRLLTFSGLYSDASFPEMAEGWQFLDQGVTTLAYPDIENIITSQLHVVCNDSDWPESVRVYQRNVAVDRVRYPMFGAAGANVWACAFWPVDPVEPPVRVDTSATILVVQNLRDPATPLAGAREMAAALGHHTRLVTVDQGGHGMYLVGTNACGDDVVTRYLVDGVRPPAGFACGQPVPSGALSGVKASPSGPPSR